MQRLNEQRVDAHTYDVLTACVFVCVCLPVCHCLPPSTPRLQVMSRFQLPPLLDADSPDFKQLQAALMAMAEPSEHRTVKSEQPLSLSCTQHVSTSHCLLFSPPASLVLCVGACVLKPEAFASPHALKPSAPLS